MRERLYKRDIWRQDAHHILAKVMEQARSLMLFDNLQFLYHYHIVARVVHQKARQFVIDVAKDDLPWRFVKCA